MACFKEWSRSGSCAIGQTFAILAGSIDLSVANLISVGAVLASYVMQGRPEMMLPAVALVLVVSAAVGFLNGAIIAWAQVNPFIATLGVGLILQGLLSASFTNFAGSVPKEFQALAYGGSAACPISVIGLFTLAAAASFVFRDDRSARTCTPWAATSRVRGWRASAPTS